MEQIFSTSSVVTTLQLVEGRLEAELKELMLKRAPLEAVGLILSTGLVVELKNYSTTPEKTYEVRRSDIMVALEGEVDQTQVVFWHSHPGGGIGPSRIDLQNKTPFHSHLVVSLVDGDMVSSWY